MINWGIIGCGNVTELKSGPAFNRVAHSRLVAVMRRDAAKAADYASRHQVPRWYNDADALIADPCVNAIYIAMPPVYHEAYATKALQAGKFVYVEKPVTTSVASCQRLLQSVQQYQGKLCVAHYRRELPCFLAIKELIKNGQIGKILLVRLNLLQPLASNLMASSETNWRVVPALSGGGLFFDLAPHQLDILIWMLGEPSHYYGLAINQRGCYQAEDVVSGTMTLGDDIIFSGNWHFTMPAELREDSCEIIGDKGTIRFAVFGHAYTLTQAGVSQTFTFEPPKHIQQPMIEKVVAYFSGLAENPCSGEEALKSLQVMEAFLGNATIRATSAS